eukprot:TRINITY_DN3838_c0_g2_i1.p1 TRINITY_DN3838_c0_g2~~TRINITY_DN3838_c0_g2_i1.p1  ORF type:complete len:282 (-),score=69.86 TRINITY_DN3838_c0_g2_i1:82-927(-)
MEKNQQQEVVKNRILVSGTHTNQKAFVQNLLKQKPPTKWKGQETFEICEYHLKTKYYTAEVEFWVSGRTYLPESLTSTMGQTSDALIFLFEPSQVKIALSELSKWSSFIESFNPSVLLCVCDNSDLDPNSIETTEYSSWCVDNGLEFLLTKPSEIEVDEDNSREKQGMERIMEALETNLWQNLKELKSVTPSTSFTETNVEKEKDDFGFKASDMMRSLLSSLKSEVIGDEDVDDEGSFSRALLGLRNIREQASHMSDDKRREVAAQVALSLLKDLEDEDSL